MQIEHYRYLLTLYPEDADVYYTLGVLYFRQGRRAEGQAALDKYQQLTAAATEQPCQMAFRSRLKTRVSLSALTPSRWDRGRLALEKRRMPRSLDRLAKQPDRGFQTAS